MIWTRLASVKEAPQGLKTVIDAKAVAVRNAEYIWLITRDDDTPVLLAGLYRPLVMFKFRWVWFVPYEAFAKQDWRGVRKLFKLLTEGCSDLGAAIDPKNIAAQRVVEHLGFSLVDETAAEKVYQWKA